MSIPSEFPCQSESDTFIKLATHFIHNKGARLTQPRKDIISVLATTSSPLSPYDIVTRSPHSPLDAVTVYRTLALLETGGLVHRVRGSAKYIRCHYGCQDAQTPSHSMVECVDCGKVRELPIPPRVDGVVAPVGFRILGHDLLFKGRCYECESP